MAMAYREGLEYLATTVSLSPLRPGIRAQRPLVAADRFCCPACFRQFSTLEVLNDHVQKAGHSVHEPQCGACHKHFKCLEALREHVLGRLKKWECSTIFQLRGCRLCLSILRSSKSLEAHMKVCLSSNWPSDSITVAVPTDNVTRSKTLNGSCFDDYLRTSVYALDCEMVGGGINGSVHLCARICLIDEDENVILHTYVQPESEVTDYRFEITGILPDHLKAAMPFKLAREKVQAILAGENLLPGRAPCRENRVLLVGHGLHHDLGCLNLDHPVDLIRDTAVYPPLLKASGGSHKLRFLVKTYLGYDIQIGMSHDPHEDASAALRLYKKMRSMTHRPSASPELYPLGCFHCWCLDAQSVSPLSDQESKSLQGSG